jgi:uncharacterized protein YndB with AHSA1/START domain
MSNPPNDRIEKQIVLRAPRARVWKALSRVEEFNAWFGSRLSGTFAPGARLTSSIDHPGYEGWTMEVVVEAVEPEARLAWRWTPHGKDPKVDYSGEKPTLVELTLADHPEGTLLRVVESGFDGVSPARRAHAFAMNDAGWAEQVQRIGRYLATGKP